MDEAFAEKDSESLITYVEKSEDSVMFNLEEAVYGRVANKYEKHIITRSKEIIKPIDTQLQVADTPSPKKEGELL